MSKIILIWEETHGIIGVANNYYNAIKFLIKEHWLCDETQIYDDSTDKWVELNIFYGRNWRDVLLNEWDLDKFNDEFVDFMGLNVEEVYEGAE